MIGKERVVDVYCGVGIIGMWVVDGVKEVCGMDVIKELIDDVKKNVKKYGMINVMYVIGIVEYWFLKWMKEGFCLDVVIVDLLRIGCDSMFLDMIIKVKLKCFVYVFCNLFMFVKDL